MNRSENSSGPHATRTPVQGAPGLYRQARRHVHMTRRLDISLYRKSFLYLALVGLTLYAVLFSTTPAVHDFFHEFRHHLMLVPCH